MYIGEFARLAGTTPKAIRLYEQLGLLPEPRRRDKYRVYRAEDLEWVGFIREAQQLGCKLSELAPLLAGLTSLAEFPWQKVEQLIAGKLAQIAAEVARLQRQHQALNQCAELLAQHPCRYGSPVERTLDKPVLGLCGIKLTHRQHLGPVHTSGERERQRWLGRAGAAARQDVQRLVRRRA